jgi:tetratricopeptide (TPR) repeat protein
VLYDRLKRESSTEKSRAIADRIRETLVLSGSATVDMLMSNCSKALEDKRYGAALDFADQVTLLDPDYAEGWNRRATIHYLMGNSGKSMSDIAQVLRLEPRHLGALSALAGILEDSGHNAQALKAWETYLSYYPADRDAQKEAIDLLDKLSGQKT